MRARWLHLLLFVLTVITTFGTQLVSTPYGEGLSDQIMNAALFSFCVMLILGSHEMGHYLMARHHQVESSLPYFIPIPLGFGTMGAVIRLKGRIPTRNALVDIGAAGPLAGLLIAIPIYAVGLSLSTVADVPAAPPFFPGSLSLWVLVPKVYALLRGTEVKLTAQFFGDNLLTWATQRGVVGVLPAGKDLFMHPVLAAAWFGMLVTMLNLMPIGQLDGGHLTHAWFGKHAITIGRAMALLLFFAIFFFSFFWVIWFLLTTKVVGFGHPEVILPEEPLSPGRKVVCAACFVFFLLTLMPVPMGILF